MKGNRSQDESAGANIRGPGGLAEAPPVRARHPSLARDLGHGDVSGSRPLLEDVGKLPDIHPGFPFPRGAAAKGKSCCPGLRQSGTAHRHAPAFTSMPVAARRDRGTSHALPTTGTSVDGLPRSVHSVFRLPG